MIKGGNIPNDLKVCLAANNFSKVMIEKIDLEGL